MSPADFRVGVPRVRGCAFCCFTLGQHREARRGASESQELPRHPNSRFKTPKIATRTPQGLKIDDRLDFHESATWFAIVGLYLNSLGEGVWGGARCLRLISELGFPEFGTCFLLFYIGTT